jgi:hypothetical protein
LFAIYDVMRTGPGVLDFPLPWASVAEISFVEPAETYRDALPKPGSQSLPNATGPLSRSTPSPRSAGRARQGPSGPPLGPQIAMGPTAPRKIANLTGMLERGVVAPTEMIARRADR